MNAAAPKGPLNVPDVLRTVAAMDSGTSLE
jgi:hypothetical protein